jgi:hypothetical protein
MSGVDLLAALEVLHLSPVGTLNVADRTDKL